MIDISRFNTWVNQVLGQYINVDWNPQNQGFGAQCWDIPASLALFLGLPRISTASAGGRWPGWAGNMVDTFPQNAEVAAAYELLPPSATVQAGDTLVWDDSYRAWFPKTHTAVAVADLGDWLDCISQNSSPSRADNPYPQWSTGPTIRQRLPRRGLLGIIRPRTGINPQGTITTSEEDDIMATKADRLLLIQELMTHPVEQADGTVTNLKAVIAENRGQHADVIRVVEGVDDLVEVDVNAARDSVNFNTQRQVEGVGRVTQQLILDNAKPAAIVDQLAAAGIVKDVADEIARRMVK